MSTTTDAAVTASININLNLLMHTAAGMVLLAGFGSGIPSHVGVVSAFSVVSTPPHTHTNKRTSSMKRNYFLHHNQDPNPNHNNNAFFRIESLIYLKGQKRDDETFVNNYNSNNNNNNILVIMDWECLFDALPYYVEIGIVVARQIWPHINELCNWETDQQWLENKLYAIGHVLSHPDSIIEDDDGDDDTQNQHQRYHVACEFALATRLFVEEQALDQNSSMSQRGKYGSKFHPSSYINQNGNIFSNNVNGIDINDPDSIRSTRNKHTLRPITVGEVTSSWRDCLRESLVIKFATEKNQFILEELDTAVANYIRSNQNNENKKKTKVLQLFPETKLVVQHTSTTTKIIVRVAHEYDNNIVSRSLTKQINSHRKLPPSSKDDPKGIVPQILLPTSFSIKNAFHRLGLLGSSIQEEKKDKKYTNDHTNLALLLRPHTVKDNNSTKENNNKKLYQNNEYHNDETWLRETMKVMASLQWSSRSLLSSSSPSSLYLTNNSNKNNDDDNDNTLPDSDSDSDSDSSPIIPSLIWIDSSWHRLRSLVPVFGDSIPGRRRQRQQQQRQESIGNSNNTNEKQLNNRAKCDILLEVDNNNNNDSSNAKRDEEENKMTKINTGSVWLSLFLAEWPETSTQAVLSTDTTTTTTKTATTVSATASSRASGITVEDLVQTSYREDAMVYPWTDSLSWKDTKEILLSSSSSSSQSQSQLPSPDNGDYQTTTTTSSSLLSSDNNYYSNIPNNTTAFQ